MNCLIHRYNLNALFNCLENIIFDLRLWNKSKFMNLAEGLRFELRKLPSKGSVIAGLTIPQQVQHHVAVYG